MNKEILTFDNIPEFIDWGNMQCNLDDKTILHYIEILDWDNDMLFELSISFYDCYYLAKVSYEDVVTDCNIIGLEGPTILSSSFQDCVEYTYWDLIKKLIIKLANEQNN